MSERKFFIDWEAADRITVLNLQDQYNDLSNEVEKTQQMDEIPEHFAADLVYNTNMLKALKRVLKHYGVTV